MIERDDNIPPLDELIVEVNRTREIAAQVLSQQVLSQQVLPQPGRQAG